MLRRAPRRGARWRLWHWLILLALAAANVALLLFLLPAMVSSAVGPEANPPSPRQIVIQNTAAQSALSASALAAFPTAMPAANPAPDAGQRYASTLSGPPQTAANAVFSQALPPGHLPAEARIEGITGRRQTLALSCESRSAADWAGYFGVSIDELEFFHGLPASDNPEFGFVGDVHGTWGQIPPAAYGVHAGPVAARLRQYGLNAYAHRGLPWDAVRAQIAAGRPVIVWVVGHVETGAPELYRARDGWTTTVARFEHTVIVVGYSETGVTVLDGKQIYTRPLEVFLQSWSVLGNLAIVRGLLPAAH